jgi:hypothetical protein
VGVDFWRGASMSAALFPEFARAAGLICVGQELITWQGSRYLDCISVAVRPGSMWARPNVVMQNPYFMAEAASAAAAGSIFRSMERRRLSAGQMAPPLADNRPNEPGRLGPLATRITYRRLGPWGVSVLGPIPRLRRLARRGSVC